MDDIQIPYFNDIESVFTVSNRRSGNWILYMKTE
jgi:hypothetical protein